MTRIKDIFTSVVNYLNGRNLLTVKTVAIASIVLVAVILALFLWPSSKNYNIPDNPEGIGFFRSLWSDCREVSILVWGKPKSVIISPERMKVNKGDIIAIVAEGTVKKGKEFLSPTEIVRIGIPGKEEKFKLDPLLPTEFSVEEYGEFEFSVSSSRGVYTGYVRESKKTFKEKPVILKVYFMNNLSGKGASPIPVKKIEVPGLPSVNIPGVKELKEGFSKIVPMVPEASSPDMGAAAEKIDAAKKQAQDYWQGRIPVEEMKRREAETSQKVIEGSKRVFKYLFDMPLEEIPPQN